MPYLFPLYQRKVAEYLAFPDCFSFWHGLAADVFCVWASCVEAAAGGRVYGAGDFACQEFLFIAAKPGVCFWYGVEQEMGVWMQGMVVKFMGVPYLADHAQEHDADPVGYELHHTQVMGNEQVGQLVLFLQVF